LCIVLCAALALLPAELEHRLHVQLLPLLLHLDQAALAFLHSFFAPDPDKAAGAGGSTDSAQPAAQGMVVCNMRDPLKGRSSRHGSVPLLK